MTGELRTLLVVGNMSDEPPTGGALRFRALAWALASVSEVDVFDVYPTHRTFECVTECDRGCRLATLTHIGADVPDPFFGYYCTRTAAALRDLVARRRPDMVIVSDIRLHRYLLAAEDAGAKRLVIDMHNAEGDMYEAMGEDRLLPGESLAEKVAGVRAIERYVTSAAAAVSVVCASDAASIRGHYDVEIVRVMPNTVSLDGITAPAAPRTNGEVSLLFTGVLSWPQNTIAALTLAREIFPLLRADLPAATLTIAGLNPTPELYDARSAGVRIVADPPETRSLFPGAIFLAPLDLGGGGHFKILESFAYGASVVTTPDGMAGIDAVAGQHYLEAQTPAEFVARAREIVEHPAVDLDRRRAAFTLIRDHYSWESTRTQLLELHYSWESTRTQLLELLDEIVTS